MSERAVSGIGIAERGDAARAIEIEIDDRWDALALSEQLIPYHSFLVQLGDRRWVVHARTPGHRGQSIDDALQAIDDWAAEREPATAVYRVGTGQVVGHALRHEHARPGAER
jgi:hypothetical protein